MAITADMEVIFYKGKSRRKTENSCKVSKSAVDQEICTHICGGVSSPSCSNYALRKAKSDNQEEYGTEYDAAETLRRKFYNEVSKYL